MSSNGIIYVPNIGRRELEKSLGIIVKDIFGEDEAEVSSSACRAKNYECIEFVVYGDGFPDDSYFDKVGEVLKNNYPDAVFAAVSSNYDIGEDLFCGYIGGQFWFFSWVEVDYEEQYSFCDDEGFAKSVNKFFEAGDVGKHIAAFLAKNQQFSIKAFRGVKGLEELPQWRELDEAIEREEDSIDIEERILEIASDYRNYASNIEVKEVVRAEKKSKASPNYETEEAKRDEEVPKEWMSQYEKYLDEDPVIDFDGTLFVFSGLPTLHGGEMDDPVVQKVIRKGGQYRSKVSGLTNYLVVDPRFAGKSKIVAAIEQLQKGKKIKIILLKDLQNALEGQNSTKKRSTTSSKISTTAAKSSPAKGTKASLDDYAIDDFNTVTKYLGNAKKIILPDGVTSIGEDAFLFNKTITSVVIPEGVETIEKGAFWGCEKLKEVTLPDTIRRIGDNAFYNDVALTRIVIPDGCEEIGEDCFTGCKNLIDIYVPASVYDIGKDAFYTFNDDTVIHTSRGSAADEMAQENDWKVNYAVDDDEDDNDEFDWDDSDDEDDNDEFDWDDSDDEDDNDEFEWDDSDDEDDNDEFDWDDSDDEEDYDGESGGFDLINFFRSIGANVGSDAEYRIPNSSEMKIRNNTLVRYLPHISNGDMVKVIVPNGITKIGKMAFLGEDEGHNDYMEGCRLPEGVTEIEHEAFALCRGMVELHLPSTLKIIGDGAFEFSGLDSLELPEGVEKLGDSVFKSCRGLQKLRIPSTVKEIGRDCFKDMGTSLLAVLSGDHSGAEIVVPTSLKDIYDKAYLDELFVNHEVEWYTVASPKKTSTAKSKSKTTSSAKSTKPRVTAAAPEEIKVSRNDCRIDSKNTLTAYTGSEKAIILPDGIKAIGAKAFELSDVTSVVIPEGCEEIEEFAFNECSKLKRVTLPGTIRKIGRSAFYHAYNIYSIVIPEGVEEIGNTAFSDCTKLRKISLPGTIRKIGSSAFARSGLTSIVIPDGCEEIGGLAFWECKKLKSATFPDTIRVIGNFIFERCAEELVIYAPKGSVADKYAQEYKLKIEYVASSSVKAQSTAVESLGSKTSSESAEKATELTDIINDLGARLVEKQNQEPSSYQSSSSIQSQQIRKMDQVPQPQPKSVEKDKTIIKIVLIVLALLIFMGFIYIGLFAR